MSSAENKDTNGSSEPRFMQYRYKLGAPTASILPSNAYHGGCVVESYMASPPVSTWLKKKTRGLRVFYFLSEEAASFERLRCKKRRLLERAGKEPDPDEHARYFYLPLEPGQMVWLAFRVPTNATLQEAVTEALWTQIDKDAIEALEWFVRFIADPDIHLNYTLHECTKTFIKDLECRRESGQAMGHLERYIGPLKNDGSVHARRRPGREFPCVV